MIRQSLDFKQQTITKLLKGKITTKEAANLLGCQRLTIYRYINKVTKNGLVALKDGRHSNNYKITNKQLLEVIQNKKQGSWRSARKVLEITNIQNISNRRIQQIFVDHGLNEINIERLKPITRFILGAKWFSRQTQINVFRVWHHCLFRWGLPKAMLSDKGSQYKSTNPKGQATYQYYAQALGIKLIFAHKARTKGKIERFWRFVQRDFVRENLRVRSFEELNKLFFTWQIKFNEEFKSDGLGMNKRTPAEVYQPSEIRKPKQELQELLTITLRRYVYTDSTISLFGIRYKIPHGYMKCRIWLHLRGDTVSLESMGRIIYRFRLKV